jgi:beta-1,4-N-acetylglucosaminyltransferase
MSLQSAMLLSLSIAVAVIVASAARLFWILPSFRAQAPASRKSSAKIVIVLGSGGHTAEMIRLLESLDFDKYAHRVYLVSSGDTLSEGKARALEIRKRGSVDTTVLL